MGQSVKFKRSSVVTNGAPKLPTVEQLNAGELAINFAQGHETLSTKNSNNEIATFSSDSVLDKKYIASGAAVGAIASLSAAVADNEYVVAQAFNDQDGRIETLENAGFLTGYTETDPTVPSWAKQSTKPTYNASEVGALPTGTTLDSISDGSTRRLSDYATTGNLNTLSSSTVAHISNTTIHLPAVTSSDNGKVLTVVNGQWSAATPLTVYTGNSAPDNLLGNNGDIYLQTS